jgi:hypothetical protein
MAAIRGQLDHRVLPLFPLTPSLPSSSTLTLSLSLSWQIRTVFLPFLPSFISPPLFTCLFLTHNIYVLLSLSPLQLFLSLLRNLFFLLQGDLIIIRSFCSVNMYVCACVCVHVPVCVCQRVETERPPNPGSHAQEGSNLWPEPARSLTHTRRYTDRRTVIYKQMKRDKPNQQ